MRSRAFSLAVLLVLVAGARSAESQLTSIPAPPPMTSIPPASTPAILGREPDVIDQARQRALAPIPQAPAQPSGPADQWVPEQRFYSSQYQREIIVPGHYESRINGQQYAVPTLPGYGTRGELPVVIPGGTRPPADLRPGP
jgi:hypothetical protein